MNKSPERELAAVTYVEADMLLTDMCRVLNAEPPIPVDIKLPARWATAQDVVTESLAWAFRSVCA